MKFQTEDQSEDELFVHSDYKRMGTHALSVNIIRVISSSRMEKKIQASHKGMTSTSLCKV